MFTPSLRPLPYRNRSYVLKFTIIFYCIHKLNWKAWRGTADAPAQLLEVPDDLDLTCNVDDLQQVNWHIRVNPLSLLVAVSSGDA